MMTERAAKASTWKRLGRFPWAPVAALRTSWRGIILAENPPDEGFFFLIC